MLARSFYEDGLDGALRRGLVQAAPGSTVDVMFSSYGPTGGRRVLRSVTRGPDGGTSTHCGRWASGAEYEVTATYAVPAVDGPVAPCTGAAAARTVAFTVGDGRSTARPWLWVVVAGDRVATARHPGRGRAGGSARAAGAGRGRADAARAGRGDGGGEPAGLRRLRRRSDPGRPVPDVDFAGAVAGCMRSSKRPAGTRPACCPGSRTRRRRRSRIVPTPGRRTRSRPRRRRTGSDQGFVHHHVEPDLHRPVRGRRGPRSVLGALPRAEPRATTSPRAPCPQGDCGDTGIKTAEVKATFAENRYRKGQGMAPAREVRGQEAAQEPGRLQEAAEEDASAQGAGEALRERQLLRQHQRRPAPGHLRPGLLRLPGGRRVRAGPIHHDRRRRVRGAVAPDPARPG